MALSNLLSIARGAMFTHQKAVDVTGHNIANASTEGYSRQRAVITTLDPARTPWGFVGRGVTVESVERWRNEYLDISYRRENSTYGKYSTLNDTLSEIEAIFGEPSETGLEASLDAFWNAWNDLANSPMNLPARTVLQMQGRAVAEQLNFFSNRVADIRTNVTARFSSEVDDINTLANQIAELNEQISRASNDAPDLADERDLIVDQISSLMNVTVTEDEFGSISLFVGDALIVDHNVTRELRIGSSSSGAVNLYAENRTSPIVPADGKFAGYLEILGEAIPGIEDRLDTLAEGLVTTVNAIHRTGGTLAGDAAGDFFDPDGTTADTIALSFAVNASADVIAAGSGSGPGDGSVALSMADLRGTPISSLGDKSASQYYMELISEVGQDVRGATMFVEAQDTLVQNFQNRRSSDSAVSLDEEMVNLVSHQTAYAAATRLFSVADEMLQDVLNMV